MAKAGLGYYKQTLTSAGNRGIVELKLLNPASRFLNNNYLSLPLRNLQLIHPTNIYPCPCLQSARSTKPSNRNLDLTVGAAASERRAQRSVVMCQVQHILGQAGCLDDASDLDCSLVLDQGSYRV